MKNYKLEIDFPLTNAFIRCFNNTFCSWGQKKTTYTTAGQIQGCTAPLWSNPSKTFYKVFFGLTLAISLLFVGSFIAIQFYNNNLITSSSITNSTTGTASDLENNKNCVNGSLEYLKSWFIVIGSIILFLNSLFCLFIACVDYASDTEWSRYLVLNLICWLALVGFLIADYLNVVDNLNFYKNDPKNLFNKSGTDSCKQLFEVNLWCNLVVAVVASIIAVFLILKIFLIAKKFFLVKNVPHTALCEDEDIIVLE